MLKSNCNEKCKEEVQAKTMDIVMTKDEIENIGNYEDYTKEEIDNSLLDYEKIVKEINNMAKNDDVYVGNTVTMFLKEMRKFPLLSKEREKILLEKFANGNETEKKYAKDELIKSNLRLVVYNAKRFVKSGIDLEDLIQEGIIGLSKGIDKFDYSKGSKLSTFATYYIINEISRYIHENGRSIRLPEHIIEKLNKYKKEKTLFVVKNGYEPDNRIMAKILGIKEKDIEELISYSNEIVSLDKKICDDGETILAEMIEDRNSISPEAYTEKSIMRNQIDKIISTLSPREQQVIRMRYGFDDDETHTLEDIGKKLNVTRERIRQIEVLALKKMKKKVKI